MPEPKDNLVERFLKDLMDIQRRYGNEMKNARTNRQAEVRELLEKFVAKETPSAN